MSKNTEPKTRSGHRYSFCEPIIIDEIIKPILIGCLNHNPASMQELAKLLNTAFDCTSIRPDMVKDWCTHLGIEVQRRSVFAVPREQVESMVETLADDTEPAPAPTLNRPPIGPPLPNPGVGGIMP